MSLCCLYHWFQQTPTLPQRCQTGHSDLSSEIAAFQRKVLFSDISNSHHFYKDKYPWSLYSGTLTPAMISGSTDSPLQSTLQSTFTDNAEILKIPFSSFLLPNDTAPRESTTFHEDSCFVTTGRHFIFSKLGSPECHSHFE